MNQKIHIIGSGVIGLTTAIILLEANYAVHIITEKLVKDTVSAKAAAIWFPFKIEPREKVNKWCQQSYQTFKNLVSSPKSGVSMIDFLVLIKKKKTLGGKKPSLKMLLEKRLKRNCLRAIN